MDEARRAMIEITTSRHFTSRPCPLPRDLTVDNTASQPHSRQGQTTRSRHEQTRTNLFTLTKNTHIKAHTHKTSAPADDPMHTSPIPAFLQQPHEHPINTLTHIPKHGTLVEVNGFEPMTPCLQSRCSPS